MSRCRAAALHYAAHGLAVFPCLPNGKKPLTAHGFKDASTDPAKIAEWFRRSPNANLAIPTGARSGMLVVDLDLKHGADGRATLAALELALGVLPATRVTGTPSGGEHRWFTMPSAPIRNSAGEIAGEVAPGVDIRGEGGYVVVPPSCIDGCSYTIVQRAAAADLPARWIEALSPPMRPTVEAPAWVPADERERTSAQRWCVVALQLEARELAATPPGARNDRLWRSAAALGGLVHLGGIDAEDVRKALTWACSTWGPRDEWKDGDTLARALTWGVRNPRSVDLADRRVA